MKFATCRSSGLPLGRSSVTDTTEQKALALVNEGRESNPLVNVSDASHYTLIKALRRAIEQHEAFRQEVSDAIEAVLSVFDQLVLDDRGEAAMRGARLVFTRFIIPKPVDPLVEVLNKISGEGGCENMDLYTYRIRAELDLLGYEIREKAGE